MSVARYRDHDPSLPWMGGSSLGPRRLTRARAETIALSSDRLALSLMLGYARSYAAAAGGMVASAAAGAALAAMGRRREAAQALAAAGACGLVVIEARRRARQWEAVIAARLWSLGADASAPATQS